MIYISSSASSKDKIKDTVVKLAELGFLNIELSGGTKYYDGIKNDLLDLKKRYEINFLIHNYFPPPPDDFVLNIASTVPYIRDSTLKFIANAIRLVKVLGSNLYTIHPGFNKSRVSEKNGRLVYEKSEKITEKENTKKDFYETLDFLLNYIIKKQNFKIGIENFFPFQNLHSFMDSQEDIIGFLARYKKEPNMGLLLDLGHLNVAANHLKFDKFNLIEKIFAGYSSKIFEIHISENDGSGDFHAISNFNSWQVELMRQNKKILDGIPIVFEWRSSPNSEIYQHYISLNRFLER